MEDFTSNTARKIAQILQDEFALYTAKIIAESINQELYETKKIANDTRDEFYKVKENVRELKIKEELYTVKETSRILKTSTAYVYELIKSKKLPVLKMGNLKIRRSSLMKFIDECEGKDITNPNEIKEL